MRRSSPPALSRRSRSSSKTASPASGSHGSSSSLRSLSSSTLPAIQPQPARLSPGSSPLFALSPLVATGDLSSLYNKAIMALSSDQQSQRAASSWASRARLSSMPVGPFSTSFERRRRSQIRRRRSSRADKRSTSQRRAIERRRKRRRRDCSRRASGLCIGIHQYSRRQRRRCGRVIVRFHR